jgi:predicted regulator of Ras-like GTPase activity (Roadblock/LC7/MglB family)
MIGDSHGTKCTPKQEADTLFAPLLGDADRTALLLDRDGIVLAGIFLDQSGSDVGEEVAAVLAGVAEEVQASTLRLDIGEWRGCVVEARHATLGLAPCGRTSLVLLAAARDSTIGSVRRLLEKVRLRAQCWLEKTE